MPRMPQGMSRFPNEVCNSASRPQGHADIHIATLPGKLDFHAYTWCWNSSDPTCFNEPQAPDWCGACYAPELSCSR